VGKSVHEIESLVAGHAPGDLPSTPIKPELQCRPLPLRVAPDAYALFLEARRALEEELGGSLDDSALITALCERALRDGGRRQPRTVNLTLLCSAHHRARHAGTLQITGIAPHALRFAHRDGTRYGGDCLAEARTALRTLGFSAGEANAAVERAQAHVGAEVELSDFIRACLRECPRPTG
jgi:hypothetical protein